MENIITDRDSTLELWVEESGAAIAAGGCTTNSASTAGSASTFSTPFGTGSTTGSAGSASTSC